MSERIQHLIVLGGGPVGLELGAGPPHARLPCQRVRCRQLSSPTRTLRLPPFCIKRLADTQVMLHPKTRVERVERSVQGIAVHFTENGEPTVLKGTHLLVATGRKPNVKSLSLERAGVAYTDQGIKVNEQLKTTNRRIYAIGDVIGGPAFTHLANYHAGIVIRNALFRLKPRRQRRHHPARCLYRPRARPDRPDRGRGAQALSPHPHLSLALCRQRPRPMRARDGRIHQGYHAARRHHSRLHHRRRRGRRVASALGGRHGQGYQDRRPHLASCCLIRPFPSSPSAWPIPIICPL